MTLVGWMWLTCGVFGGSTERFKYCFFIFLLILSTKTYPLLHNGHVGTVANVVHWPTWLYEAIWK